ncbi:MAG: RluA family pseudouridine synthase [Planctomycetota bacterium]|nr:MAG: RluA family pseudouridine synthase [Planctomycetota bacterium]
MSDPTGPLDAARIRGEVAMTRKLSASHRLIEVHLHGSSADGLRLDRFLAVICPSLTRSLFQMWIQRGEVLHNAQIAQASRRVAKGDHIRVYAQLPANPDNLEHHDAALNIVYAEEDFLVVDKPPGQLVHQAGRVFHGTLLGQVQRYLEERGRDPEEARLVNRIDRETSGLVLVGLSAHTQRLLSQALERRDVEKTYLALAHGCPQPSHGHWRDPIGPGLDGTPKRMVRADGQSCHTEYETVESRAGISLLRITLHTGRQHQIRLHAAHHGHPLVGDWVYGQACQGLPGQALHAHRLSFRHPHHGDVITITSALPSALQDIWQAADRGLAPKMRQLNEAEQLRLKDADQGRRRRLPPWIDSETAAMIQQEMGYPPLSANDQVDGGSSSKDQHESIE